MNRRETVRVFRDRLTEVIERSGHGRSAFAGRIGVDRSTLAQILSPTNDRLPRAETLAAIANDQQVSVDWLLGLSQGGPLAASIIDQPLEIAPGAHSPADERLTRWHAEVVGYKVRYVPTTLPDLLKTEAVIRYEYSDYVGPIPESRIQAATERLAHQRRPESDMEVCCSRQSLETFARGQGVWCNLGAEARREQLSWMSYLIDELYPTFRWFLYDGVQRYSAPLTIFGHKRAAIYVGHMYFVFNSTEHIRVLSEHFDALIRAAVVQPPEITGLLGRLLAELDEKTERTAGAGRKEKCHG